MSWVYQNHGAKKMGKFISPNSKIFEHESQHGGNMSQFAIAHAMKKKRMAKGGCVEGCQCAKCMSEGGEVNRVNKMRSQHMNLQDKRGDQKGVHAPSYTNEKDKGRSEAGDVVRQYKGSSGSFKDSKMEMAKDEHKSKLEEMQSMPDPKLKGLAEGGEVGEQSPLSKGDMYDDLVDRIMMHKSYSEGGKVSNDVGDGEIADEKENQFDDLVLDDDMEFNYTGDNSGDHIGDEQEDDDRRDIVSKIMKSNRKKDRNPRPA